MRIKNSSPGQLLFDFPQRQEFIFSNFVLFRGNEFAFNAAKQIAEDPACPYQSLFLYGGRNLGKTHLLISIGNHIAQRFPEKKALYIHGEDFSRIVEDNSPDVVGQILKKWRQIDFFLLDDVDRISGKPGAQEKLYGLYNSHLEQKKKIILTGSLQPKDLSGTEHYLISRFQWGMTAELKPLDDQTRTRLLVKLGDDLGLTFPDPVVKFLMVRVPRDFYSIKQTVEKINQESLRLKRKITIPLVKAALESSFLKDL